ncbi:MAG: hypothetical protein IIC73_08265, partial [Armatimonadetes bacterium]|nr:hypothetical protein [Armatimonadota bacterium]
MAKKDKKERSTVQLKLPPPRLKKLHRETVAAQLTEQFKYSTPMQVPT